MNQRRRVLPWALVGVGLLFVALSAGRPGEDGAPLDPDSTGELGTKALVLLLERLDTDVDRTSVPDDHDVALLLADDLDEVRGEELQRWIRSGGTLVVTDPGSSFAAVPGGDFFGGLVDASIGQGTCDIAALRDVGRVDPGNGVPYAVERSDQSCFGDGTEAFVVARDLGGGTVVSIGGAGTFVNANLGVEDNAVLAASLLAPREGTSLAFLEPPLPGSGEDGLFDLVPARVKQAVLQLGVAFLVYALWRGIRLGKPVDEVQLVQIEGSELVRAVGNLFQGRADPRRAAQILSDELRNRLADAVGIPRSAEVHLAADAIAARFGLDRDAVVRLLRPDHVLTDDALVGHARELDALRQEVLRGEHHAAQP